MTTVITCESVSKEFRIPVREHTSLRGRILHPFSGARYREFGALDDVSFSVQEGEFFGIVGRNGSGKSTMLKVLAGIYAADTGSIDIHGSLAPFIELGVGFNFELSGRDNVYLNGALLGLSKKQLNERYEHIVAFAELEEFMELKLANYSSGMQVRLAFAIAVESDADILLVDEVLAVGDEKFQRKCFNVFRQRKAAGKTVVFVSHDMGAVKEFCDRAMLLHHGKVVEIGPSRSVAQAYYHLNAPDQAERDHEFDTGWIGELSIQPSTTSPDDVVWIAHGDTVRLKAPIVIRQDLTAPSYGFIITDMRGRHILATNTSFTDTQPPAVRAGETVEVEFEFKNRLGVGEYTVTVTLEEADSTDPIDIRRDAFDFSVSMDNPTGAMVELPHDISVRLIGAGD